MGKRLNFVPILNNLLSSSEPLHPCVGQFSLLLALLVSVALPQLPRPGQRSPEGSGDAAAALVRGAG